LLFLVAGDRLPALALDWLAPMGFMQAWKQGQSEWLSPSSHLGFIRTQWESENWHTRSTGFLLQAQRAARTISKLPGNVPGQMAAAIQELEANIQEHSGAAPTGVLVFRATSNFFEFVVADRGMGLLSSLRSSSQYLGLNDHGLALELALTDGVSRHNDPGHGNGFRPIFQGLSDLNGYLRFRNGDHALIMDGTAPDLATAQLSQKPFIDGFLASICCATSASPPQALGRAHVHEPSSL
jgi:anti-sigma regulatory factor (Ser/Thr protein kinase)